MAKIKVTGPDGSSVILHAPEGASEEQIAAKINEIKSQWHTSKPEVSTAEALGRGALQGATFGLGDELYGGAAGLYDKLFGSGDFSGTYAKQRDAVRAANDAAQEAHPTAYFGGELAGGAALPLGALGTGVRAARAANATLAARSVAAAKEGAALGGLYGFGTGRGDIGDQAVSTVAGAVGGGLIGGAVPGAVDLAGALVRVPMQAARVVAKPKNFAAEKFVEAMGRDAGRDSIGVGNPVLSAANRLAVARGQTESPLMLADMGGENTRNLVRAANNMPNAAAERFKQVLDRRQATQPRRLEQGLSDKLAHGEDFYGDVNSIIEARDKMADPMFKAAFAIETPMTPNLSRVLQRPTMRELIGHVNRRLADEDKPIGLMTRSEALHRVKLELDDQIGMSLKSEKMGNRPQAGWDTRTLMTLKKDLLNAIDNNAYKYALQKYAGPSALKNAAEDGLDEALKLPPEQIAAKLKDMTKSEADMWRQGAARAIIDRVRTGNFMRDRTKSIFDTPDMQLRMKHIFPDNKSRGEFLRIVANERKMVQTRQAAQGNSTTAKQLTQGVEAGKAAKFVGEAIGAAKGNLGALQQLAERGYNFASGITPGVAEEILKMAMATGKNTASRSSSRAIQQAAERLQRRRAVQGLLSDALLPAPAILSAEAGSSFARP